MAEKKTFISVLKTIFGIYIIKSIWNFLKKDKGEPDESDEERREREKEPDSLLILGVGAGVATLAAKAAYSTMVDSVSKMELPSTDVGLAGGEPEENEVVVTSNEKGFFDYIIEGFKEGYNSDVTIAPKGEIPSGFRQAPKVEVRNIKGVFEYKNTEYAGAQYANPLNIRPRQDSSGNIAERQRDIWQGETGHHFSRSGAFVAFSDPYYSFRAAAHLIGNAYQKRDGKNTIREWIYTYCPTKDRYAKGGVQASQAYVDFVVSKVNEYGRLRNKYGTITENTPLNFWDKDVYMSVLKAMAYNESKCDVSWEYLSAVYDADVYGKTPPLQNYILNNGGRVDNYYTTNTSFSKDCQRQKVDKRLYKVNE